MSREELPSRSKRLLFIDDSPIATRDDQRKNRKAKSHTARVIWESQRRRRHDSRSGPPSGSSLPAAVRSRGKTSSEEVPEDTLPHSSLDIDGGYEDAYGDLIDWQANPPGSVVLSHGLAPTKQQEKDFFPLSRTISPMFGGAANGFNISDTSVVAVTTDYCFNVLLKSTLSADQLPAWFLAYSQNPIVYHCMSYAVGIYQESTGIATPKVEQQTLVHKGQTINLVNQSLPDLDHTDLEAVMLGIFVLWRVNFTKAGSQETLLFRPYIPEANLITEFGKFDAIDAHANALHWLIEKAGGIDNIKLPGLKLILSNGDLLESTARCTRPRLPCMWQDDFPTLDKLLPLASPHILAAGFAYSVPGGLPELAQTTLQRVRRLDMLLDLSHHRRLDDALFTSLMATRNTIQHEILALPKWQELDEVERSGSQFATYETCRITALMYANAVLFPMPPSTGWHLKLLDELRQMLQMTNLVAWREDTSALLIWSLAIASIAAFRTIHRRYFRDTLKKVLLDAQITTWPAMESSLKSFLWTDSACGQGGAVLWEALGMDVIE